MSYARNQDTPSERRDAKLLPAVNSIWKTVHEEMRQEFGEPIFRSWLKDLRVNDFYHGTLELLVATRFMRDWIDTHYQERILKLLKNKNKEIQRLEFIIENTDSTKAEKNHNRRKHSRAKAPQIHDSYGPDVRIRGTSQQIMEKYLELAREAAMEGKVLLSENYLQYAEHFQMVIKQEEEFTQPPRLFASMAFKTPNKDPMNVNNDLETALELEIENLNKITKRILAETNDFAAEQKQKQEKISSQINLILKKQEKLTDTKWVNNG